MKIKHDKKTHYTQKHNNNSWGVLKYSIFISTAIVIIGLSVGIGFRLNNSNITPDNVVPSTRTTTPTTSSTENNSKDTRKQTTTPTKTNSSTTTQSSKPYKPSVCTETSIPYETITIYDSNLNVGQSESSGGRTGTKSECTADSSGHKLPGYTFKPVDKIVRIGTRPVQSTGQVTYEQAVNYCNSIGATSNTSAHQTCINAYLSNNGP